MNANLNRLLRDYDECTNYVLPLSQRRPNVHRELVKVAQHLVRDIEASPDYTDGSLKNVSFFVPQRNANADNIEELAKDLELINTLMNVSNRRVRTKLITLQFKTQQALRDIKEHGEEPAATFDELAIFLSTLALLKDRPHVWNQVVVEVQRLQKEQKQQQQPEELSVWGFLSGTKPPTSKSPKSFQWQPETRRTSEERWQDVERIDEVLDTVPEKSSAHHMLDQLKKKCATEARALQRVEAHHMTFAPLDTNALDSSLSNMAY